ncbi:cytochrome c oxidase subunit 4 [Longivirga aurantiaca]|uniref:Cytochrome c oxidase polypeptide 4 n=1 Tax=Longivirga aurantiaca TaxID=1837743 RepID=A0ABW1T267_9ACTN
MKIEGALFAIGTAFFGVVAIAYWFITKEIVGTTALALTGGLAFLVGFYLLFTARRVGTRPEDDPLAVIEDAEPDYGFFSPHSWWPIAVAIATGITVMGLVFAVWLLILGVGLLLLSIVGFVFEYYVGEFAD